MPSMRARPRRAAGAWAITANPCASDRWLMASSRSAGVMIVKVKVWPTCRWWARAKVRSTQTPFGSSGAGCRPATMSGRPTR